VQFFVVLEKFTCAYLFQIALEIIRLPIQIASSAKVSQNTPLRAKFVSEYEKLKQIGNSLFPFIDGSCHE